MSWLAHLLSDIGRHWVLSALAFAILAPLLWASFVWLRGRRRRRRVIEVAVAENLKAPTSYLQATGRVGLKPSLRGGGFYAAGLIALVLFGLFGERLTSPLIYHHGETGEAIVTGTHPTGDLWNYQPVIAFDVLIRKANGGIVRTGFRSDSFNVYPAASAVRYPPVGIRFNVRYLPVHPEDFVIITDDGSDWARSLRCSGLLDSLATARRAADFAPGDTALARTRDTALAAARTGGCLPGGN